MSWMSEWEAISNRISGLKEATQFFVQFQQQDEKGSMGIVLLPQTEKLYKLIHRFHETYKSTFSPIAQVCIENYLKQDKELIESLPQNEPAFNQIPYLKRLITSLISFQAELTFHLSDTQFIIHRMTERAFIHLQRLIIVDETIRNKWKKCFKLEIFCEKLGAAHLLWHGIWAFKAHGEKGRTDLILGESVNLNQVEATSEGLVMTEWKLVKDKKDTQKKATEAYKQAKIYSGGILAGIELRNYRYLVLVSEKNLILPEDFQEGEIIYKHINVAISPDTPAISSRQ